MRHGNQESGVLDKKIRVRGRTTPFEPLVICGPPFSGKVPYIPYMLKICIDFIDRTFHLFVARIIQICCTLHN